jgi:hypothetical protein
MRSCTHWIASVAVTTACAGEPEVVVGSACDADAPTTIVRLEPGEVVERIWGLDDELALFRVGSTDDDESEGRLLVATTCGDDQRELARGLDVTSVDELVTACDAEAGRVVSLDPTSDAPARTLAEGVACAIVRIDEGLLAVSASASGFGTLLWIGLDGARHELLAGVRTPTGPVLGAEPFAVDGGRVLALTQAAELVQVDLDGASTIVRAGVADFRASADLRFVAWQRAPADGPAGESEIVVLDRQLDVEKELFAARLSWSWSPFATGYLVLRHEAWGDDRVFTLPDVGVVALPPEISVRGVTDVGQIAYAFGTGDWHDVELWRWDPRDDSNVLLVDGAALLGFADDGLEVFLPARDAGLQRGDVELRAWDDGAARLLAREVPSTYTRRDDGWIAAVHDEDGDRRGVLRLHEGDDAIDVADDAWIYDAGLDKGRVFGSDVVFSTEDGEGAALVRVSVPR